MKFKKKYHIKVNGINFFEGVYLKWIGKKDGRKALPFKDERSVWMSPFIDREIHCFQEYCSAAWESLQVQKADEWVELSQILNALDEKKRQLNIAIENLNYVMHQEVGVERERRYGEKKLNDTQVKARRVREQNQRLSTYRNKVSTLEKEYEEELKRVTVKFSKLSEDMNSTRMNCKRMKEHLYQRLDVYWNAAWINHDQKEGMTIIPVIEAWPTNVEDDYLLLHRPLIEKIERIKVNQNAEEEK